MHIITTIVLNTLVHNKMYSTPAQELNMFAHMSTCIYNLTPGQERMVLQPQVARALRMATPRRSGAPLVALVGMVLGLGRLLVAEAGASLDADFVAHYHRNAKNDLLESLLWHRFVTYNQPYIFP